MGNILLFSFTDHVLNPGGGKFPKLSPSYPSKLLEEDLVPFEARLVLLLVPGSETDVIVTKAFKLDLINSETVWVTGDGSAHFMVCYFFVTSMIFLWVTGDGSAHFI